MVRAAPEGPLPGLEGLPRGEPVGLLSAGGPTSPRCPRANFFLPELGLFEADVLGYGMKEGSGEIECGLDLQFVACEVH